MIDIQRFMERQLRKEYLETYFFQAPNGNVPKSQLYPTYEEWLKEQDLEVDD